MSLQSIAPLRHPVFRLLWAAALFSNIGSWMQTVGAQWYLLATPHGTLVVSLVQAAATAPFLAFGIPSGVLGELLNRRRLLIGVQVFQICVAGSLALLTGAGRMTPELLLVLTFLLGAGQAVQLPAYQALVPEMVSREQIPAAATLSAAAVNIGRAVGPAVAGVLLVRAGVQWVFAIDAASFVAFLVILLGWRGYRPPAPVHETAGSAMLAGLRYTGHAPVIRRILLRLALFVVPASSLWALIPLLASRRMHVGSGGYGIALAALGIGSVLGAFTLGTARGRWGANPVVGVASAVYGAGLCWVALTPSLPYAVPVLIVMGLTWIWVVSCLSGLAQSFFPVWVRTRGLSLYQLTFFGSMAAGSALAGSLASWAGLTRTALGAGAVVVVVAVSQVRWRLVEQSAMSRDPGTLGIPEMAVAEPDSGTLVLVRYVVDAGDQAAFLNGMRLVERSRRRTGARSWHLYTQPEGAGAFTEAFTVGSWREHLEQHTQRMTAYDRSVVDAVDRLSREPIAVTHLVQVTMSGSGKREAPDGSPVRSFGE